MSTSASPEPPGSRNKLKRKASVANMPEAGFLAAAQYSTECWDGMPGAWPTPDPDLVPRARPRPCLHTVVKGISKDVFKFVFTREWHDDFRNVFAQYFGSTLRPQTHFSNSPVLRDDGSIKRRKLDHDSLDHDLMDLSPNYYRDRTSQSFPPSSPPPPSSPTPPPKRIQTEADHNPSAVAAVVSAQAAEGYNPSAENAEVNVRNAQDVDGQASSAAATQDDTSNAQITEVNVPNAQTIEVIVPSDDAAQANVAGAQTVDASSIAAMPQANESGQANASSTQTVDASSIAATPQPNASNPPTAQGDGSSAETPNLTVGVLKPPHKDVARLSGVLPPAPDHTSNPRTSAQLHKRALQRAQQAARRVRKLNHRFQEVAAASRKHRESHLADLQDSHLSQPNDDAQDEVELQYENAQEEASHQHEIVEEEASFHYQNDLSELSDAPKQTRFAETVRVRHFFSEEAVDGSLESTIENLLSSPGQPSPPKKTNQVAESPTSKHGADLEVTATTGLAPTSNEASQSPPEKVQVLQPLHQPTHQKSPGQAQDNIELDASESVGFHGIPANFLDSSDEETSFVAIDPAHEVPASFQPAVEVVHEPQVSASPEPAVNVLPPIIQPTTCEELHTIDNAARSTEYGRKSSAPVVPDKLTAHDFGTLLPGLFNGSPSAWLNDNVVNEYLSVIVEHEKKKAGYVHKRGGPAPPVHAFASQWYPTAMKDVKSVGRWAGRKQLGGKNFLNAELVLFPICDGSHWRLIAVKPKERSVEYLDSLGGKGHKYTTKMLEYLAQELGKDFKEEEWSILTSQRSSLQQNTSDCGVFTLMNGLVLLRGEALKRVVSSNGMMDARRRIALTLLTGIPTGETL
ncbi:hypothetical protein BDV95DRAFT_604814 [Massariosphaeria phaeospora]|uniref:Ubiquitin-like protease family profile domain-containing protein n=1 Tax=Massariosphaeria phaeospora TaxID=100035 RepID=A0A7C8MC79_9PLEO|nr:hypothetical protein BDV95DRAFT_604814 [Massariosphaeria phaeospora]